MKILGDDRASPKFQQPILGPQSEQRSNDSVPNRRARLRQYDELLRTQKGPAGKMEISKNDWSDDQSHFTQTTRMNIEGTPYNIGLQERPYRKGGKNAERQQPR